MKVVVDKLPKKPKDCIFSENLPVITQIGTLSVYDGFVREGCRFNPGEKCNLLENSECPYLQSAFIASNFGTF